MKIVGRSILYLIETEVDGSKFVFNIDLPQPPNELEYDKQALAKVQAKIDSGSFEACEVITNGESTRAQMVEVKYKYNEGGK